MAGERTLVSLYGGAKEEWLDDLRYRRFCYKISKGTSHVEPRTLPPTSAAVMYRGLPMQTDRPAAPAELLDIIYCSCKKLCNTKRCTCRQHGLQWSDVCRECRGTSCSTSELPDVPDDCMDWSHCAMLAHQKIVVLSFKGATRLSEDTSANDHACSMSWEVMSTHIFSVILEI